MTATLGPYAPGCPRVPGRRNRPPPPYGPPGGPYGERSAFERRLEGGAQRHARPPVAVELDAEHLVELDPVELEAEPGPGHVEPPDPRRALADLGDRLVPVVVEVAASAGERLGVVLAEVLLVAYLEPGVV